MLGTGRRVGEEIEHEISVLGGDAHETLVAPKEAKDSGRFPGRGGRPRRGGNALEAGLGEGRSCSVAQVGVAAPCRVRGERPSLFSALLFFP